MLTHPMHPLRLLRPDLKLPTFIIVGEIGQVTDIGSMVPQPISAGNVGLAVVMPVDPLYPLRGST